MDDGWVTFTFRESVYADAYLVIVDDKVSFPAYISYSYVENDAGIRLRTRHQSYPVCGKEPPV